MTARAYECQDSGKTNACHSKELPAPAVLRLGYGGWRRFFELTRVLCVGVGQQSQSEESRANSSNTLQPGVEEACCKDS